MQAAKLTLRKASAKLDTRVQSSTHAREVRAREALALARYLLRIDRNSLELGVPHCLEKSISTVDISICLHLSE